MEIQKEKVIEGLKETQMKLKTENQTKSKELKDA